MNSSSGQIVAYIASSGAAAQTEPPKRYRIGYVTVQVNGRCIAAAAYLAHVDS
jgi:hypothetical protein